MIYSMMLTAEVDSAASQHAAMQPVTSWSTNLQGIWLTADVAIILLLTVILLLRDIEGKNRPFPNRPIIFSSPFLWLMFLQASIVFGFLAALVGTGKSTFSNPTTMIDATWVGVAGISLLKGLPAPKGQDAQQLWGLADWLFAKFYRSIRARIILLSNQFQGYLSKRYAADIPLFHTHVNLLINFLSESPKDTVEETARVATGLDNATDKVSFLVNYAGPRTTQIEWVNLVGS